MMAMLLRHPPQAAADDTHGKLGRRPDAPALVIQHLHNDNSTSPLYELLAALKTAADRHSRSAEQKHYLPTQI